jgi:glycosyltransferase involved in cell wall biosynthesis
MVLASPDSPGDSPPGARRRADRRRILIDGYNLALPHGTGIGTYARNLSQAVHDIGAEVSLIYGHPSSTRGQDPLLTEVEFFDPPERPSSRLRALTRRSRLAAAAVTACLRRPTAHEVPVSGRVVTEGVNPQLPYFDLIYNRPNLFGIAWAHFALFGRALAVSVPAPIDIAHWTCPIPLRLKGARNVYTLHDLVPLKLPYTTLDSKRFYLRLVRQLAATGDHLVTVSQRSKADIVELLGVPAEGVSVTYQTSDLVAPPAGMAADHAGQPVAKMFGLVPGRYFLFIGAIEPKKNVGRLIEAALSSNSKMPLVLAGPRAWKAAQELTLLDRRVRTLGFVPRPLLVDLMRHARALIFPSLYEGFGLPVLEAMAVGTPVITSRTSSLPEIGGDAVLYIDPYRVDELRAAIERMAADDELAATLRAKGMEQAAKFSPQAYRARLVELYDRVDGLPPQ